jgi:hypothetical protein
MAAPVSAALICSKCAAPGAPGKPCAKCGGALVKVCGGCGAKNSPTKNYCDGCGAAMALAPTGHPPEQRPNIPSPSESEPPLTVIRKLPSQKPSGPPPLGLPPAAGPQTPPPDLYDGLTPGPLQDYDPNASLTRLRRRDRVKNAGLLLALAILFSIGVRFWAQFQSPESVAPRQAAKYLDALRNAEIDTAYQMLSEEAQKHVTRDEFADLRDTTPWSWSDLQVVRAETDAVVLKYTLQPMGQQARQDILQFTLENGEWVRPYNWSLLKKAENALERNDADLALLLSKAAVEINTRDPMARAYLCEAVFYRRNPVDTARECELALELHEQYPSKLSERSLYHLHALLGDTYKNALRRYPDALREYNTLLSFPSLTAADRCRLVSARAETLAAMGRAEEAQADANAAASLCSEPSRPSRSRLDQKGTPQ